MTRVVLIILATFLLISAYAVSPYFGLYRIISAVQTKAAPALSESVDFHRLRRSLTSQIIETYLKLTGRTATLGQFNAGVLASIGTAISEPMVDQMLNLED